MPPATSANSEDPVRARKPPSDEGERTQDGFAARPPRPSGNGSGAEQRNNSGHCLTWRTLDRSGRGFVSPAECRTPASGPGVRLSAAVCGQTPGMSSHAAPREDQAAEEQVPDEPPSDEQAPDEQAGHDAEERGASSAPKADHDPDADRIAEVAERIDKARSHAQDAGVLIDEGEETFADSGATKSGDDQTIAPPG